MSDLSTQDQAALKEAVAVASSQPAGITPLFGLPTPDLSGVLGNLGGAKEVLDKVVTALDTLLGYAWLIPDQYEAPLNALANGLKKVQGWLTK